MRVGCGGMRGKCERMEWRRGEECWVTLDATPCSRKRTASTDWGSNGGGGGGGGGERGDEGSTPTFPQDVNLTFYTIFLHRMFGISMHYNVSHSTVVLCI